MKRNSTINLLGCFTLLSICACSSDGSDGNTDVIQPPVENKLAINISTNISSRATEEAFEAGDCVGLYVANYGKDGKPTALKTSGNHVDNLKFTYNGTWTPTQAASWQDSTTHADFYLYYPFTSSISSVDAMPFNVKEDQSKEADYKACDLLIGKAADIAPTKNEIMITAKHVMSQMAIKVVPGNGFTQTSLDAAKVAVKVNGVKTTSTVNLATATATATATGNAKSITAYKAGETYKAIIVPQPANVNNIITVYINGEEFCLSGDPAFKAFATGKRHTFTVTVSKTSSGLNANISKWEDDGRDYGGTAEEIN